MICSLISQSDHNRMYVSLGTEGYVALQIVSLCELDQSVYLEYQFRTH
jgi:hypothetical protein